MWHTTTGWYSETNSGAPYPYVRPPNAPTRITTAMPPPSGPPPSLMGLNLPPPKTCFICKAPGHLATSCPQRMTRSEHTTSTPQLTTARSATGMATATGSHPSGPSTAGSDTSSRPAKRKIGEKVAPSQFDIPSGPLPTLPPLSTAPVVPATGAPSQATTAPQPVAPPALAPTSVTTQMPSTATAVEQMWDTVIDQPPLVIVSTPATHAPTPILAHPLSTSAPDTYTTPSLTHTPASTPLPLTTSATTFTPTTTLLCTKHNCPGGLYVNSNLTQLFQQASQIYITTPAPSIVAFGLPSCLGPALDALGDSHSFLIPADILYTHLHALRDMYEKQVDDLRATAADLRERLNAPTEAPQADNVMDNATAYDPSTDSNQHTATDLNLAPMDVQMMHVPDSQRITPFSQPLPDTALITSPSPMPPEYMTAPTTPPPLAAAQATHPMTSTQPSPTPSLQPYIDTSLAQMASPQILAPAPIATQMPVAPVAQYPVAALDSLPPWAQTLITNGMTGLTGADLIRWAQQTLAAASQFAAIPARPAIIPAPDAQPADWLHASPYTHAFDSLPAQPVGTNVAPTDPLSINPAQPLITPLLPQSTPALLATPSMPSSHSLSISSDHAHSRPLSNILTNPPSRRASVDATSTRASDTTSMSIPIGVDSSASSSNALLVAGPASLPAVPLGPIAPAVANGHSDSPIYVSASQSPTTSIASIVCTGQSFLVSTTLTPLTQTGPTVISTATSVAPSLNVTVTAPSVAPPVPPHTPAQRPTALLLSTSALTTRTPDQTSTQALPSSPTSTTTSAPDFTPGSIAQRLRQGATRAKAHTQIISSDTEEDTNASKKARSTSDSPSPSSTTASGPATRSGTPPPLLAKKSEKPEPPVSVPPFTYTPKPNLNRQDQFYNQVVECVLHYCPLLAQQLEIHISVSPFPLATCQLGGGDLGGYWCPSMVETLALLLRAPCIPALTWKDIHLMFNTWMDIGPVPPLVALQAFTSKRQAESSYKTNHPFMRVREAFYPDGFHGTKGPLDVIITGPANLKEVVDDLTAMVHRWGGLAANTLGPLAVRGPEFTTDSLEIIRRIHLDLQIPSLTLPQLTDALFHDPCHLLIGTPGTLPRFSNKKSMLEKAVNLHHRPEPNVPPVFDLNLLRLTPIEPSYVLEKFLPLRPRDARDLIAIDLQNDFVPYPLQLLALLPISPARNAQLTCMDKYIRETLIPAKNALPNAVHYPLLSRPARIPNLVQRMKPLISPRDKPIFDRTHEDKHLIVMDLELGVRKVGSENQNVPIIITLMDRHGHVLFHAGVKPPGGIPYMTKPKITGVTKSEVGFFPSFETVYPFLYRFLAPHIHLIGHGLDADLSALGIRVPACKVFDTSTYLGIRALAIENLTRNNLPIPPTLSLDNPNRVGLETLVQSLSGLEFRDPNKPHDPIADCLVTLALFAKVHTEFLDAWQANTPALASRNVGIGFPLDSVRAAFLPADNLLSSPALEFDRNEKPHEEIPAAFQIEKYYHTDYLRQPLEWKRPHINVDAIHRAHQAAIRIASLPLTLAALPKESYDGFAANFARYTDATGESREGPGSMSRPDPDDENDEYPDSSNEAPFSRGSDLPLCGAPTEFDINGDRSGVFLLRRSRGADRLREGDRYTTDGEFGVTLPVPVAEWRTIWRPVF